MPSMEEKEKGKLEEEITWWIGARRDYKQGLGKVSARKHMTSIHLNCCPVVPVNNEKVFGHFTCTILKMETHKKHLRNPEACHWSSSTFQ